jgi:hypothetical protein
MLICAIGAKVWFNSFTNHLTFIGGASTVPPMLITIDGSNSATSRVFYFAAKSSNFFVEHTAIAHVQWCQKYKPNLSILPWLL